MSLPLTNEVVKDVRAFIASQEIKFFMNKFTRARASYDHLKGIDLPEEFEFLEPVVEAQVAEEQPIDVDAAVGRLNAAETAEEAESVLTDFRRLASFYHGAMAYASMSILAALGSRSRPVHPQAKENNGKTGKANRAAAESAKKKRRKQNRLARKQGVFQDAVESQTDFMASRHIQTAVGEERPEQLRRPSRQEFIEELEMDGDAAEEAEEFVVEPEDDEDDYAPDSDTDDSEMSDPENSDDGPEMEAQPTKDGKEHMATQTDDQIIVIPLQPDTASSTRAHDE
ncbi:hypothetical protein EDD86DRAFT_256843 [Gorgonomyces haynaldii]|nr:hypothetical protein EDD86DRAFT_256843 [Gorgonomyces haynaldii]